MSGFAAAFNAGTGAWISDCGLLVEPTSDSALTNGTASLPLGLYSHSDQIAQWQTSLPDGRGATGVAGRIADQLAVSANGAGIVSMNISLGGSNIWQTGREVVEYAINATGTGSEPLVGYNDPDAAFLTAAVDALLSGDTRCGVANTVADYAAPSTRERNLVTRSRRPIATRYKAPFPHAVF